MKDERLWDRRRAVVGTGLSLAAVVVILGLHYGAALHAFGLHDVLRRLFYLPVITAAIAAGMRGGLLTAGVAALGYLPHLEQLSRAGDRGLDHALELVLLPLVGVLVGGFADASRRARALAAERGRMAALGEVGMAIMAQAEGPLASIAGQAEALSVLALREESAAIGFTAGIIRDEAARARRFLDDMRGLGQPADRRPAAVDLSALVAGVTQEIVLSPAAERLTLGAIEGRARVVADRAALAFSLRTLLLGLLESLPAPGTLVVTVIEESDAKPTIAIEVYSSAGPLPDLEHRLRMVFGPRVSDYRFREALCVHLLAAEGASVEFHRSSADRGVVRIRFPRDIEPLHRGGHVQPRRARRRREMAMTRLA